MNAPRPAKRIGPVPLERHEMLVLAQYLDARGFDWFHVPNEGKRSRMQGAQLKRLGLKKGCPDVHIWNQPPGLHGVTGVVIELKRRDATPSAVSAEQLDWLARARRHGKKATTAFGAADAIEWLEKLFPKGWRPEGDQPRRKP